MDEMDESEPFLPYYFCAIMNGNKNHLHIGHLVQAQLKADHRSVGWLAREIGCTRNNVYKIFNKASLDSDLLLRISKAMQFNFFRYYTAEVTNFLKERIGEE
jgi:DNA-binding phage protein